MATTIQISERTKQTLDLLKDNEKIRTNDDVIQLLLSTKTKIPDSMFGALKGKKMKWTKEDRFDFNEL